MQTMQLMRKSNVVSVKKNQRSLVAELELKKEKNLYRQRVVTSPAFQSKVTVSAIPKAFQVATTEAICFCSNDYLGLATHPQVIAACQQAVATYGVGSTASPLVAGYKKIHQQFEEEFADFVGMERALLFSSGYLANLGAITAAVDRNALVYQDKENHASLIDAVVLSRAKSLRYRDLAGLQRQLERGAAVEAEHRAVKLIITESVFSMSGREANLETLVKTAAQHGTWLLVDEAHGLGVLGKHGNGALVATLARMRTEHAQVNNNVTDINNSVNSCSINIHHELKLPNEVILTASLGKAFGCSGGVVAGSHAYIEHCLQQARSYIYSTGIPPAIVAANLASLHLIQKETWRREHLLALIKQFRAGAVALGLDLLPSDTPIQSIVIGDEKLALEISEQLLTKKIWVRAMRYPTVPVGKACLRVGITALHSYSDMVYLLEQLQACMLCASKV